MTTNTSKPTAQGGFLHGIPQSSDILPIGTTSSGCCGTSSQATARGCCGEPLVQIASAQPSSQRSQGCCGEPATTSVTLQTSGCCGEPINGASSSNTSCCN